jgi:hypothetical protein
MKDYDIYYTAPDTETKMSCKVCRSECKVERSKTGPTGYAEAVAGRGHWHDEFSCPNRGKLWHDQALNLVLELENTPSNRLAELMRLDLEELLRANGC